LGGEVRVALEAFGERAGHPKGRAIPRHLTPQTLLERVKGYPVQEPHEADADESIAKLYQRFSAAGKKLRKKKALRLAEWIVREAGKLDHSTKVLIFCGAFVQLLDRLPAAEAEKLAGPLAKVIVRQRFRVKTLVAHPSQIIPAVLGRVPPA